MRDTTQELEHWLRAGGRRVGQILIAPAGEGWELRHTDDAGREDLTVFSKWEDARAISNLDDAGAFRPLKTAPSLRHGWRLVLPDAHSVRLSLEYFYPAMLGVWLAHRDGEVKPVDLNHTLGRQTGMYRITQKLTHEQAQRLIAKQCRSNGGCLKTILWQISQGICVPLLPPEKFRADATAADTMPLLCQEACNFLVAAARKMVKDESPAVPPTP
ncbi:MAG: DR2241 family protein [Chthoniobacteraceae bacterium]